MTGNAINAKSDELSSEQLDAVSGGWFCVYAGFRAPSIGGEGGQNDQAAMFQQILQQLGGG